MNLHTPKTQLASKHSHTDMSMQTRVCFTTLTIGCKKIYLINYFFDQIISHICSLLVAYQRHQPFSSTWLSLTIILNLADKQ